MLLVKVIDSLTEWHIPVSSIDIRLIVKSYLDKQGIVDIRFKDNVPGIDWVRLFMKRNNLTKRIADNVKSSHALVNKEVIDKYFDNLSVELAGIPPERLFNYDETNITDDPGSKTVIVRRGHGHRVECKLDHSKQSTSVMFASNAAGRYLSPMVVYKAQNLYRGWTGGPVDTVYDVTKNEWFDGRTFERWFFQPFLPIATSYPGVKGLISDNLGSHFSPAVINSLLENNIKFITMPRNATHLCQLLDVDVFHGLKQAWKAILSQWCIDSRVKGAIPKENLPTMLYKLQGKLRSESLVNGFRATGIYT